MAALECRIQDDATAQVGEALAQPHVFDARQTAVKATRAQKGILAYGTQAGPERGNQSALFLMHLAMQQVAKAT